MIGHVNPDMDAIAAAIGYAWLLREIDGEDAVAARAGALNPQTAWVLDDLNLEAPMLLTDASARFESVMRRFDATTPDRPLRDAWAIANRTGSIAPVVEEDNAPFGLITGWSLFSYLSETVGAIRRFDIPTGLAASERLVEAFPNEPDALVLRLISLSVDAGGAEASSPKWKALEESQVAIDRVDPNNPWDEVNLGVAMNNNPTVFGEDHNKKAYELLNEVLARDDLAPSARAGVLVWRGQVLRLMGDTLWAFPLWKNEIIPTTATCFHCDPVSCSRCSLRHLLLSITMTMPP